MMTPKKPHDLDILNNPDSWPLWPVMPVKRPSRKGQFGMPEIGLVVAGSTHTVYLGNYASLKTGLLAPQLEVMPSIRYDSYQQMLADGWMVD